MHIPVSWLPLVKMRRIVSHWTAGSYVANSTDKQAYHLITELKNGKPNYVKGVPSIAFNSGGLQDGYAAHTRGLNTDSIGMSIACMGGAREAPFDAGKWPMTLDLFMAHCEAIAQCAAFYEIPITRQTILTHAEVQPTLGVAQRAKWDYTRLPFKPELKGAIPIGDYMREQVARFLHMQPYQREELEAMPIPVNVRPAMPEGATVEVTTKGDNLRARRAPGGDIVGNVPNGTRLTVVQSDNEWVQATTPQGYTHWFARDFVTPVDGPLPAAPTTPATRRLIYAEIRERLDLLETTEGE